jgi:hypothetical protein
MPGFYTRFVEVPPGADEHQGYNLQFASLFSASPGGDLLTTVSPVDTVVGEVVILTTTGILPAPLQPFKYYRVVSAGLGRWVRWGSPTDWVTASAATDLWTTPSPHGLAVGAAVFFYDFNDGYGSNIPLPLINVVTYYVAASGFTATTFKVSYTNGGPPVDLTTNSGPNIWLFITGTGGSTTLQLADNAGWNPPPENPPIDITDVGTGIHSLWVRPLDYVGTFITSGGNMTTELIGGAGTSGCRYWGNPPRIKNSGHRFQVGSPPPGGMVANTDYNSGEYTRPPVTPSGQWSVAGLSGGAYSGNLYDYGDGTILNDGLGDLGSVTTERYYIISGDVIIIGGGGGGGGAGEGGGQPLIVKLPRPTIKVRDPELASLIRRARRAAQTIENLSIVGDGVSGDSSGGFALND